MNMSNEKEKLNNIIEYLCTIMEEKYYVQIKGGLICTKAKELPCICIEEEILGQAVNAMMSFLVLSQVKTKLIIINGVFIPGIYIIDDKGADLLYIGIKEKKGIFDGKSIQRKQCNKIEDNCYYRLKEYKGVDEYNEHRKEIERNIPTCIYQEHYSVAKYRFVLKIFSKIRLCNNRSIVHFAIYELVLFLSPKRMHGLLESLISEENYTDKSCLCTFLKQHIQFLIELYTRVHGQKIRLDIFASCFKKYFQVDIVYIIKEFTQKESSKLPLMLYDSLKSQISTTYIKKLNKEKDDLEANSNHKELADVYSKLADLCKNKVKQGLPEECKSNY